MMTTVKLEDGRGADLKDLMLGSDGSGNGYPMRLNSDGQLEIAGLKGENATDDRLYGGNAPASKLQRANSGAIKASGGKYYGYIVITATAVGDIIIYDNTSGTGNAVDRIVSGTATGTHGVLASPVPCSNGMYAAYGSGATGSVLFLFT